MIRGTPEEIRAYKLQNYHKNKDKNKEEKLLKKKLYKQANKEHIREVSKARYLRHKEAGTSYYDRNKEIIKKKVKLYRLKNIQKVKESDAKKQKRRRSDPFFRFKDNLRTRIRSSFSSCGFTKKSTAFKILGCSYEYFRSHIESKFEPWMTWENYGNKQGYPTAQYQSWDLDHIIPISSAKTEEEAIKLCHYTNFQPLCSYTNRYIKSDN